MKKLIYLSVFLVMGLISKTYSNGVCIKDAAEAVYFKLLSSEVNVLVNNQVAILSSTQCFINNTGGDAVIKYAFPLYDDASPTSLRWKINGIWYTAIFAPQPQDTTLPGGGDPDPNLMDFLGETPMFFNLPDTIMQDSLLYVELTYVQLLPYNFGIVGFLYPNDYSLVQNEILDFQKFHFILESERTIENIELLSHDNASIVNTGNFAEIIFELYESMANTDYEVEYILNSEELGLFSFSTFLPDSTNECDNLGNGFLAFIVEPDPSDSLEIVQKVFTLIVDRSGSMSGDKIIQARNAASFIVNNLNEGDFFNIVDFDSDVNSLFEDHMLFNVTTQNQALDYIENLQADDLTNISGAFSTALEDFAGNDTTFANIIIFFTDGQATAGLTGTQEILEHIQNQLNYFEITQLQIHSFGIGMDVNNQLLSLIASQNNGLSEFLLANELEEMITYFYLKIRNPVLLNIEMNFDPPIITETYPNPLTNLYLGQQLIVVGRYDTAETVTATFSGNAFGQPQVYSYDLSISDSLIVANQFLVKIWAKKKIEYLYVEYFKYPENSPEAEEIKNEIIDLSLCYNVLSPFTSFTGGGGGGYTSVEYDNSMSEESNSRTSFSYPNPFRQETTVHFTVYDFYYGQAIIEIYDMVGRLINSMEIVINGPQSYEFVWDGKNQSGEIMPIGHYYYNIKMGDKVLKGSILKY